MHLRLPNFVIIGSMKCATSTLHEQLARQPGFFMCEPKEPNFFSDDDVYAQGPGYYSGLFAEGEYAQLRGESSTHYTKLPTYPKTIPRMRAMLPQLKLIYVMRHPIDRLISHYIHEWSMRNISAPLDLALDRHPELVEYGRYQMQLAPYIDAYGRENILPVFLERMQSESQVELERVCKFLAYQGAPHWSDDVERQNVSSERLRLGKFTRELFDNPVLAGIRRRMVPQFVRTAMKARLTMQHRPELSEARKVQLAARFDRDLEPLGKALGIELRCDNFKAQVRARPLEWVG